MIGHSTAYVHSASGMKIFCDPCGDAQVSTEIKPWGGMTPERAERSSGKNRLLQVGIALRLRSGQA